MFFIKTNDFKNMIINATATFKLAYKKCIFLGLFIFAISPLQAQQKPQYTQYMFNPMAINPSFMAMDEMLNITVLGRSQWSGFEGAPNTQTVSMHTPYKTSNSFYGAILTRDNIGQVITETGGNLAFSRRVKIGDISWLAMGVNGGFSYYHALYSQASQSSIGDQTFLDERNTRMNLGMGLVFFNKKYYWGVSSPHFYGRDISDSRNANTATAFRPHFLMQTGGIFKLAHDFKLRPSLLVKYVDGSPAQFDLNANLLIKELYWFGAAYRYQDSFSLLASAYITPTILFGYAYDIPNFNNPNSARKASHEIMLQFRLPVKGRDPLACFF
jgi:type IX secretion system PorP/SprF family membrane protein